ncbi:hypothetical protein Taro_011685 [Colocasia esculenta]|uniref:Uncharacterized protein n=1 Tax=Colocasia esculenta TaxID=4460 RepID=A0A843U6Y7_COLES|nr:hypothetical protein [Colocasia esculenta]
MTARRDNHTASNADRENSAWTRNTSYEKHYHWSTCQVRPLMSYPRPKSKPPCLFGVRQDTKNTTVIAVVWPDYGPTPGLSRRFQGRKE